MWASIMKFFQDLLANLFPPKPKPSPSDDLLNKIMGIILNYNKSFLNPLKGAEIHKLTAEQVLAIGKAIEKASKTSTLPLPYMLACIAQESCFDPACYNKNLKGKNPSGSFEGTDWGMCQFSGRYLPTKPGMKGLSQPQMIAKAGDPNWAVPMFVMTMEDNLSWAIAQLNLHPNLKKVIPNAFFLATLAYNAGRTGSLTEANLGTIRPHPSQVASKCQAIAAKLGVADPMATQHLSFKN